MVDVVDVDGGLDGDVDFDFDPPLDPPVVAVPLLVPAGGGAAWPGELLAQALRTSARPPQHTSTAGLRRRPWRGRGGASEGESEGESEAEGESEGEGEGTV